MIEKDEKVNTNIALPRELWKRAKVAAAEREISLAQLVRNGIRLAVNDDETITIDAEGNVHNDLKGVFNR